MLCHAPVVSFLKQIGFEEDEEKVFLDTFDTHALFFVEECLSELINNHKMQNKEQNQHFDKVQTKIERDPENLCLPNNIVLPAAKNSGS